MPHTPDFQAAAAVLANLLQQKGIRDTRVLKAMAETPREKFLNTFQQNVAYEDRALGIGSGQTISQPFVVARMTELLELRNKLDERVLEIGTGSGYQTAILARLTPTVVSVERVPALYERTKQVLAGLGVQNVELHLGDGSLGWPDKAPYDAILVTAAAPALPTSLVSQLKPGGRLVAPVGSQDSQVLKVLVNSAVGPTVRDDFGCRFVPLIGKQGFTVDTTTSAP